MSENNKIQCVTEIEKQEKSESGRSMVEMLGTLAIIGVLSIGGIAGYTHAMNKSKANDILDGVSKRAVVASQQMIMTGTASLVEYNNQKIGDYEVSLDNTCGDGFFGIKVEGVEQAVCERLKDQGLVNAVKIELGGTVLADATCADGNGNVLTYVFNDSLNANATVGDNTGEDDPNVCDESEKVIKQYFTGDCCSTRVSESFCPDEVVPTCVVDESSYDSCYDECSNDSGMWSESVGRCCLGNSSYIDDKECCDWYTGGGSFVGGHCCFLSTASMSPECCAYINDNFEGYSAIWTGTECQLSD